ncbi:DUF1003 domain-containing protein [Nevskia sp.]|uniref:DUF1003 domain-containing protein n=1 Tax=Nevskia sp. TaxID=1929292 RepID=UPI0025D3A18C|nr:DUF1003 domain-containing protein [Nevskia sp.]
MSHDLHLLRRVPLFAGLSDADLSGIAERMTPRKLTVGETLFVRGEPGSALYVIVRGTVRVLLPSAKPGMKPVVLEQLDAGEFVGEMALIDSAPRMASVDSPGGAELLELTRDNFLLQLDGSPRIGIAMLAIMSKRLRIAAELLGTTASRDINKEADAQLTWAQKLADRVAEWNGSWSFLILLFAGTAIWATVNAIPGLQFDPYPYQFFNFFLAFLVAVQGPLLMMSQNRQTKKERLHADADFEVNLKNETGIHRILFEIAELRDELESLRSDRRNSVSHAENAEDAEKSDS